MVVTMPLLFLFLSSLSKAEYQDLQLYKACLMECLNCVQTYGKDIYNGKLCAENCAISHGESIDSKCYPPEKRGGSHQPRLTHECARSCQSACSSRSAGRGVDSYSCIFRCILSNFKMVNC